MRREGGALASRALISAMFWVITLYFLWHSLHARVEANWFAPVYPAFAIAAAVAADVTQWERYQQRLANFCLRWASPVGILMFAALIVQANTGCAFRLSPRRHRAQRRRRLEERWPPRSRRRACVSGHLACSRLITAPRAGSTFYLPKDTCVIQPTQRIRWVNMGEPDPAKLSGKLLWVDEVRPASALRDGNVRQRSSGSASSSACAGRW